MIALSRQETGAEAKGNARELELGEGARVPSHSHACRGLREGED